jgi:hypothetical protein
MRAAALMALAACGVVGLGWVFSRLGLFLSGWILTGAMP